MSVDTSSEQGLTRNVSDLTSGSRPSESIETTQLMHATTDEPASQPLTNAVWTETAIAQSTSESTRSEFKATDAAWLLLPLWFAIVWVVLFFAFSEGFRFTQSRLKKLQPASQIPCKNCRFYTSSAYLKCAVNPLDAATERAIACSDFDSKQTEDSSHSPPRNNDVKLR
ncbi:hypothetical protein H6F93_15750 [Leptolyngbya sp. FACHB-671]|uniref:hypothetical protein n=1 Tax=unclassified Leptolyngbya TaxID=2650499 RepID=UPI001689C323|nr:MULTISPECIES: hypothetical protein [unclassified Leptolyngbya]MBD1869309.1 hypothetical protein [Cyanobacteria bacterium FACHB-471]MBD1995538.1 hypothetical protein [Leptolyngbya sp. FACHB-541]MBD2068957.1 hypothetical protein [Leptolyngbya sp. FACHB-671]